MRWIDAPTDADVALQAAEHETDLREQVTGGGFWGDRCKKLKDRPAERLDLASQHLPLPRAFREAAIALRALIRDGRKNNQDIEPHLHKLYELAAVRSMMVGYAARIQQPGYNVMAVIPGKKIRDLPFSYKTLGYDQLTLLKATDIKWMVESWGEPEKHTTLNAMYPEIWREYENKLEVIQRNRLDDMFKSLEQPDAEPVYESPPSPARQAQHPPPPLREKSQLTSNQIILMVITTVIALLFIMLRD